MRSFGTNALYSWGHLIEIPDSIQLNNVYNIDIYDDNLNDFAGFTLIAGTQVQDSALFQAVSDDATIFIFKGAAPY